ncbi:MAG: Threonyl-tRNA synthetase [Gemmatimonadetes bacterium]|nr:Threonyl-tRNA synthetase [Gemmatimonadota bacterium]
MIDRPSEELTLTLPDGSTRMVAYGTLPRDVVASIGAGLLRAAVAVEINGAVQDLVTPLRESGAFRVLTEKDERSLDVLRHSAAHLLATAVRRLHPKAAIGFGPAIEDGFYYDFQVAEPFTPDDLAKIEEEMRRAANEKFPFVREEVDRRGAQQKFIDDPLKLERLSELGEDEVISTYTDGPFIDLCRGPHVPDTSRIKHFKLLHTAGAYWRGDEHRQMLQRIYGTAWWNKEDLAAYLHRIEEAKRRDHRTLGRELDLFSTDPRVGAGLILWHPNGGVIRREIEDFERELILRHGYDLVYSPHIVNEKLFEISGHLQTFKENMFGPIEVEGQFYRPKPMNCPGHIVIYQSRQRSYRDLPIRYAEFGTVYRYERSGVLHGMLRVRGFTQDDAHVFCTPEQVPVEIERLLDLVHEMLAVFGYPYTIELATRPENGLGTPEMWDRAVKTLSDVLTARGQAFTIDEGGGAFYGPKLDFKLIDAIGRKWQGPTVQLDFNLPERFQLEYIGADNAAHRPVMLHRVLVGSMERFVGGLIEHYAGAFPLWLAPQQIAVIPITPDVGPAAAELAHKLADAGIRVGYDAENREDYRERIKTASKMKVPYMAIIGKREAEAGMVALRFRGSEKKQETISVDALIERLKAEIATRALHPAGALQPLENGL